MTFEHHKNCITCPEQEEKTLTFSNCTQVVGSDNPANANTILFVDTEITANAVAFSLENTGQNAIEVTVTFSDGDNPFTNTVEVGHSLAGVFANVASISIRNAAGLPIRANFKYQITYTFDV